MDNRSNKLNSLLEFLKVVLQYERDGKNLPAYLAKANAVLTLPTKLTVCGTCSSLMKRYHTEIQRKVWNEIRDENPLYVPELPAFNSLRYNTEYSRKTLVVAPFDDLKANEALCHTEALKARRMKNPLVEQNCFDDRTALINYRLTKLNYFDDFLPQLEEKIQLEANLALIEAQEKADERAFQLSLIEPKDRRDRSINKDELVRLRLEKGLSQKSLASHFGVSVPAICKMLKEMTNEGRI